MLASQRLSTHVHVCVRVVALQMRALRRQISAYPQIQEYAIFKLLCPDLGLPSGLNGWYQHNSEGCNSNKESLKVWKEMSKTCMHAVTHITSCFLRALSLSLSWRRTAAQDTTQDTTQEMSVPHEW